MAEVVLNSNNLIIEYEHENQLLKAVFNIGFGELDDEGLLDLLGNFPKIIEKYSIKGILFDLYKAHFALTQEMYKALFNTLTENFFANDIILFAYIMPEDYVSRVGLELFFGKLLGYDKEILKKLGKDTLFPHVRRGYFDDNQKAYSWLVDKIKSTN